MRPGHERDRRQHQHVGEPVADLVEQLASGVDPAGPSRQRPVEQVEDEASRGRQRDDDQDPRRGRRHEDGGAGDRTDRDRREGQGIGWDAGSLESPEDGVETAQQRRFDAVQIHGRPPVVASTEMDGKSHPPTQ